MKFAIQSKWLMSDDYNIMFENAKSIGFDAVEITYFDNVFDGKVVDDVKSAMNKTKVPVSALCGGYRNWIGDFDDNKRLEAVDGIKKSLENLASIGAVGLIAPAAYGMATKRLPPYTVARSVEDDKRVLVDSLSRIAETAEKYGMYLLFEPLNRYEDHMINRVEQAVEIIDLVGSKYIRVMADFYHMNIEEADISVTISKYKDYIKYYHLSDSNRHQPGLGHINFKTYLGLINSFGFDGFLSIECALYGEGREPLEKSISYLKSIL
ncbi:D-tagatose 3-epimerase [Caloramator mitchellensis]|uniref:D-tagatose 3-epimerase n=1 Tax=Caloramator mitchellensis TaxID=908809 RepID=A0A0R3JVQ8_CALMK|nr:sugar phosphate isomerase/epimerase family protein [Caloramator mitchellensis]KRQ87619.1 D-tagatose 3-epimerase [Caloramator mitchellensis]